MTISFISNLKTTAILSRRRQKKKYLSRSTGLNKRKNTWGTGIALPLSRSLAELHKGKLELEQTVDNFNIFLLSTPVHQENEISLGEYETIENDVLSPAENGDADARQ